MRLRSRRLVKTSPKTQKKIARLLAFDLATGKKQHAVELDKLVEGQHFCNDMTIDGDGNVFVTDSFSPVIYRVDPKYKAIGVPQVRHLQR